MQNAYCDIKEDAIIDYEEFVDYNDHIGRSGMLFFVQDISFFLYLTITETIMIICQR